MQFNNRDDIIQMTSYWTGERFPDGRPRVSDSVLERLRNMSIEEVWRLAWMKLNNYQFQGEFKCTHNTQKPTVGRAVTATFVPIREDLELAMMRQAKSQGMKGMYNQWVVDGLVEDDVFVADLFDKTEYGTLVGGNLATVIRQKTKRGGIWYTPQSGIWQTVWIEPVAKSHISGIKAIPNLDQKNIAVTVAAENCTTGDLVEVKILDKGKLVASATGLPGSPLRLCIGEPKLWSPDSPFLYDMEVSLRQGGKTVDKVDSYTAMRKIGTKRDKGGILRMTLNDKPLFHFGPLDQGWWPDGLFTAPTDEALLFDILKTKELGYNMIRKHVKVEPARWYYHCDREGILVWQDMPSGDMGNKWEMYTYNGGTDKNRTQESKDNFSKEWKEIMDLCMSSPSVVVWVPFNEAWGQFDTERIVNWTMEYDPSRLVNPASGGNHRPCGHMLDLHNYPGPAMKLFDPQRVNVLGEYGGIGLPMEGHLWWNKRNWGYVQFKTPEEVTAEYEKYAKSLIKYVRLGFSGAVYTQTTDVEGEVNGLFTYDRKVMKVLPERLKAANKAVIESMPLKME